MKTRLLPTPATTLRISLSLLAVLLAACAPDAIPSNPPAAATQAPTILEPGATLASPTLEPASQPLLSGATREAGSAVEGPLPVATSRGPDLDATDPATVSLAAGGLQFVEFFRFT
jgi:hypothetical protein